MVTLLGCGSGATMTLDEYTRGAVTAQCQLELACCTGSDLALLHGQPIASAAQCEQVADGAAQPIEAALQASIDGGRLSFDGEAAARCIAAAQAETACAGVTTNHLLDDGFRTSAIAVCDSVFLPKVGLGQSCVQGFECSTGDCNGGCTVPPGQGSACATACAAGLFCATTCEPLEPAGQACTGSASCESGVCAGSACVAVCAGSGI
jgi:hypothetical protein